MESDLEYRILARFDEIECHMNEIVSACDKPRGATRDCHRLLLALDERLAALADSLDEGAG
jgi:hypothetical protein